MHCRLTNLSAYKPTAQRDVEPLNPCRELFTSLYDYPKFGTPFKRGSRYAQVCWAGGLRGHSSLDSECVLSGAPIAAHIPHGRHGPVEQKGCCDSSLINRGGQICTCISPACTTVVVAITCDHHMCAVWHGVCLQVLLLPQLRAAAAVRAVRPGQPQG
jgi:hypothetical protein